jgi:hypothetical protein
MAAVNDARVDALKEIELSQKRIDVMNERMAISNEKHAKQLRAQIEDEKKYLKIKQDQISADDKRIARNEKLRQKTKEKKELEESVKKNIEEQVETWGKLDTATKKQINSQKDGQILTAAFTKEIIDLEKNRKTLTGKELEANNEKLQFFKEQQEAYLQSIKSQVDSGSKLTAEEKERAELEKKIVGWSREQQALARINLITEQQLTKNEERRNKLQEHFSELQADLPSELGEMVQKAQKFGDALKGASAFLLPFALLGAAAEVFVELDKSAQKFREDTGMTRTMMAELGEHVHDIEKDFQQMGLDASKAFSVANQLGNVFSDTSATLDKGVLTALTSVTEATGLSAENAAKVQGVFEQVGHLSAATAASLQQQVTDLAVANKVSPRETLEQIADSAATTSKFFHGDIQLLAKQAIEARKLGVTLDDLAKTAEHLLNFEEGIEKELVASTFVGGQFNLNRARALAMEGKLAEATEETLNQIQRSGDFTKQSYFTQKALAEAAGMTVEEVNREIGIRNKLSHLSKEEREAAMKAKELGLDISKIKDGDLKGKTEEFLKQNKINGQVTEMGNTFKAIVVQVGSVFLPIMQKLGDVFGFLAEHMGIVKGLLIAAGVYATAIAIQSALAAKQTAVRAALEQDILIMQARNLGLKTEGLLLSTEEAEVSAASSAAKIFGGLASTGGLIGLLAAGGIIGAMFSSMNSAKSEVKPTGDFELASGDNSPVLMAKGQAYQFDKSDDIIARPGLSNALANGGNSGGNGISVLSSKMDKMVSALMNQNTNLYVDGHKMNTVQAQAVSKTTRNFFQLGGVQ